MKPLIDAPSTQGIQLQRGAVWLRRSVELFSSMRFAISLLVIIAIASIAGTVVQQNQPSINYLNQFGPFWAELFKQLSLYSVYSAAWFWLLLTFLVTSTSLCVLRNAPKFLRDMRSFRDSVREDSLRAFHHKAEVQSTLSRAAALEKLSQLLQQRGFRFQVKAHENATLIAAKAGTSNRLGYIATHAAIVVMAVGYLFDTDLPLRAQMWWHNKQPIKGNAFITEVPAASRLSANNMSFRGNALIPEGQDTDVAILNFQDGALVQELPFTLKLNRFHVEYYPTGMPRSFVSDVTLTDKKTGAVIERAIEVNKPLIHRGIAIYQSSFDDGGSLLTLTGYPMQGPRHYHFPLQGQVGQSEVLSRDGSEKNYRIEFTGLRVINVENLPGSSDETSAKKSWFSPPASHSAHLRNVGPSVQYKVRDNAGQAREYHNYMLPVELGGRRVFLSGTRDTPDGEFKYLRIPADDQQTPEEFMRLRAALQNPALRQQAAQQFSRRAMPAHPTAGLQDTLSTSALRGLEVFAQGGFQAMAQLIESNIAENERAKAAQALVKILEGSLWELWQVARQQAGLSVLPPDEAHRDWLQASTNALSDSFLYGAPVLLTLKNFQHVQASVFQMARAPGTTTVYLGCLLLVLGIFTMFYVRERRLWLWLKDTPAHVDTDTAAANNTGTHNSGTQLLMAMSSPRRTLDFEQEFTQWQGELSRLEKSS